MIPTVRPLTDAQATLLTRFLSSPQRPMDTFSYPQLAGFLFSVANGPELIQPSEWIPLVFNDQSAQYKTEEEANDVLQAMMALYNDCLRERTGVTWSLPPGCEMSPQPMDNLTTDAPLSQWAQGLASAMTIWQKYGRPTRRRSLMRISGQCS